MRNKHYLDITLPVGDDEWDLWIVGRHYPSHGATGDPGGGDPPVEDSFEIETIRRVQMGVVGAELTDVEEVLLRAEHNIEAVCIMELGER